MKTPGAILRSGDDIPTTMQRLAKQTQAGRLPELEKHHQQLISAVFARMKSIYGHLWSSNYRSDDQLKLAQVEWVNAFRRHHFTLGDINATLDYLADRQADMPNLPTFVEYAKSMRLRARAEREARTGDHLALPESPEQAEARAAQEAAAREEKRQQYQKTGKPYMDRMKAMLEDK